MKKTPNLLQRTPGGNWTFRVKRNVDGKPREKWISTGTPVKATAMVEARRLMEEVNRAHRDGKWERLGLLHWRTDLPSIEELQGRYEERIERESVRAPGLAARAAYWRNLRSVLAWGRAVNPSEDVREGVWGLDVSALSEELVKSFRVNWLSVVAPGDAAGEASRRRSGDSMLRQARACFSAEALRCYSGWTLPDLSGWLKAGGFGSAAPQHAEISGGALAGMAEGAEVLKGVNARLYVAHLLAKFCGLRNNEIWAARVGWFRELVYGEGRPGQWVLEISERTGFVPKGFSFGQVPICREVMREIVAGWRALGVNLDDAAAFAVPGATETERRDVVDREHASWVRRFLPGRASRRTRIPPPEAGGAEVGRECYAKAGYELRRWGRQRMAAKYRSREVGEAFIRHKGPADAGRNYQAQFYAWGELGDDIGITLADARGGVSGGATAMVRTGFGGL